VSEETLANSPTGRAGRGQGRALEDTLLPAGERCPQTCIHTQHTNTGERTLLRPPAPRGLAGVCPPSQSAPLTHRDDLTARMRDVVGLLCDTV